MPSEGATQNFSVSFYSLSPTPLILQDGGMAAYVAYEAETTSSSSPSAWLLFIPASSNASSYILSVLVFSQSSLVGQGALVWMANRNNPVSGNFSLSLNQTSGNLVLVDGNGSVAWVSNNTTVAQGLVSMDLVTDPNSYPTIGTVLLSDAKNKTLWQSSDHPTDTLVTNQFFQPGMSLISWASATDPSEGLYSLVMEAGGLALYYNAFPLRQPYWIWSYHGRNDSFGVTHTCGNLTSAFMDPEGGLLLEESGEIATLDSKSPGLCTADSVNGSFSKREEIFADYGSRGPSDVTILLLKYDGNLLAYTLGSPWTVELDLFTNNRCLLPNYCGPYGICTPPSNCACPSDPSFPSTLFSNLSLGCPPTHKLTCYNLDSSQSQQKFVPLSGVDYFSNNYSSPLNFSTQDTCTDACLQNCSCLAAFWHVHSSSCFHVDDMGSLRGSLNNSYLAFLKVEDISQSKSSSARLIARVVSGTTGLLILFCILAAFIYKKSRIHLESEEEEAFWNSVPGLPTRFSYGDLYSITTGFGEQMGKGGFGAVYAGVLQDGTRVAVKRLESVRQGKKEFRAEVVILGGIHHYNLVGLIGFCAEGSHRLLVYEYMAKGSLDQWLSSAETPPLHWKNRFNVALGAARGLAYLHGECKDTIIHLDIKPQNILLDEDFVAKVSDFGLSTLMGRDETHVITTMRGTPGYLAPEWLTEGSAISEKCDVFSFGKVLMEILGGRRNLDPSLAETEKLYFPSWLYHQVAQEGRDAACTHIAGVETPEETRQARFMMKTGFLCVLDNPDLRPSMQTVVHMLEGRAPELEHLQLSDLFQGLHFALTTPSPNLAQNRIEEALAPIYQSSSLKVGMSQAGVMSFSISAR